MRSSTSRILTVLILVSIIAIGFIYRSWFSREIMPPPDRMQGETTQSYRYARMLSTGESIPDLDRMVMHPGGMATSQNSIFEEYIAGGLHRITGGDFDDFIRVFCLLFPLFAIPFIYLWMRVSGYGEWISLASSSLYIFILPALARARGGSFYRETVALPVLIALGWLCERALSTVDGERTGRSSHIWPIAAGIVLFLSLAAWKVSAFISFFLLLYLFWRNWKQRNVPFALRLSLACAQILASVLLSHMRHDGALISPSTFMSVFLLIPPIGPVWFPVAGTAASILAAFLGSGATGHVSAVIVAKLRFLFSHPSDPLQLSEDARLFWVPGYTSPPPSQLLYFFGIPVLAAVPGIAPFVREKRNRLVFWFLLLSLAGYLFFDRLMVFLAVAIIPVMAMSMKRGKWFAGAVFLLLLAQSVFPASVAGAMSSMGIDFVDSSSLLSDREVDSLLLWLDENTEGDDAVMSYWHISGLISAYAERPVVTHTFFENRENRRTIMRFARSIYASEDSLVAFMREKDCHLLVYQADFILDRSSSGLLYLAGLTEVPPGSVAMEMQYHPRRLDSLNLVFQGPSLRIFSLGPEEVPDPSRHFLFEDRYRYLCDDYETARAILAYPLAYSQELGNRALENRDPGMISAALLLGLYGGGDQQVVEQMLNDLIQLYIQDDYELDYLAEDIHSFLSYNGYRPELGLLLARLYGSEGRNDDSEREYVELLENDPGNVEARRELMMIRDAE